MGTLHEHNRSLWVDDGETAVTAWAPLTGAQEADVVVVGGGLTGLLAAWCCQRDGADVVVVEAGSLAAGATGYTTAKISALQGLVYDELRGRFGRQAAADYAGANTAGLELIAELVRELDIDCDFSRRPAFTYTEEPSGVAAIEAEVRAASDAGLAASLTTVTDLPWPVAGAVRVEDQAQFHPRRFCLGLARAIVERGGRVHEHSRAVGYHDARPGRLELGSGSVTADRVVVATHLPFLDRGGFFARCSPTRSYCLSLTVGGDVPTGMYISSDEVTRSVRAADGDTRMVVGGEGHPVGQEADTRQRYTALENWARDRFDVVSVDHRWSAQDYRSVDGLPYVGPLLPNSDTVLVATAYRKWGMTNGAAAALIIADAISSRANPWAQLLTPSRINLRHSALPLVKHNAETAIHFVTDRAAALASHHPGELEPGSGRVVARQGKMVAEYRDDAGRLHEVSPVCPHLGCHVTFNTAERSWDCPCHGSRFDVDGHVLEGPAVRDLGAR